MQLPFTGDASADLLQAAQDAVRNGLLARGVQGPDPTTVRAALGVTPPSDTQGIVAFGRSMGATHVLVGRVTPLTGQYNLELRLYEVSSSRVALQQRNVGDGEEGTVIPEMLSGLFAPGAMQLSPEEQARQAEEARRQAEEQRRAEEARRAEEQRRREEEARQRAEAERRRREEADRLRPVYPFAAGGPISIGGGLFFGGRLSPLPPMLASRPPPSPLVAGLRAEGAYAVLAQYGVEIGATLGIVTSPTIAFGAAATGRIAYPWRSHLPIRGSVGVALGVMGEFSGARAAGFWFSADVRGEWDATRNITVFAGLVTDEITGAFFSLGGIAGVRVRFGAESPTAPASSPPPASTDQAPATSSSPPPTDNSVPAATAPSEPPPTQPPPPQPYGPGTLSVPTGG